MPKMKSNKKSNINIKKQSNEMPTHERLKRGGIVIRDNIAQAEEPLRIDKLLKNGIIDEMQHLYGMQIITYWMTANRPFLATMKYERVGGRTIDSDYVCLSRMGAEDMFHKTMARLNERERELIRRICFDEQGALEAGRALGLPVNGVTQYVRMAFDALGDALAAVRDLRKTLEKAHEDALKIREELC